MAHWHPWECKVCGARRPWVSISQTGYCPVHSRAAMERALVEMRTGSGEAYEKWLRNIARGVVRAAKRHAAVDDSRDEV